MIHLIVLRCRDLEQSRDFYEAIGLRFRSEQHGGGPSHLACEQDGVVFELYPWTGDDSAGLRVGLTVDSLAAAAERLRAIGISVAINDSLRLVVRDPDGHSVVLQEASS